VNVMKVKKMDEISKEMPINVGKRDEKWLEIE
jgi:hypothetical protein